MVLLIIAGVITNIALIVKFWTMCNNVKEVKKIAEGTNEVSMEELIFLHKADECAFAKTLLRVIYMELLMKCRSTDDPHCEYVVAYDKWIKVCENNGWEFPSMLEGLNTMPKFQDVFLPK